MAKFTSRRSKPELVAPAWATPNERKCLSDIDNQPSLRFYATFVEFFQPSSTFDGSRPSDPAKAIKSALADALVYYYPIAGRLTELPEGRLVVDCTAEGVVFVEADADVGLEELGKPLLPPYPCVDEFLCDPGDTKMVVGKPLFFLQVTRLKCGGFVVGFHMCHNISDGFGMLNFIRAIADIARGEALPTIFPLWNRELFTMFFPPRISHVHLAYEALRDGNLGNDIMQSTPPGAMVGQYFLFGPTEISAMRSHLSAHLRQSSTIFELISGAIWKCRTAALDYSPGQLVRFMFTLNSRGKWKRNPPVPQGYYGCGLVLPVAETLVADLCGNPLEYAVQLVRKAKFNVTDEYIKSTVDMIASRKWPSLIVDRTYIVSDITTIGEDKIDFGWGKRVGGGIPMAGDIMSKLLSYFMKCKNADGEDCVVVPMYLPSIIMDRFATEISVWSRKQGNKFIVNAFN
uniref:Uncharacterized protein n=1 Tax=Oryza nivara TaxID=4536 RepID=A0A0E0J0L8_ORYNI